MAGPIQVPLPGLLSLLQLKNRGRNPGELLEQVRPTIELRDWYFAAQAEVILAQTSAVQFNTSGFLGASTGENVVPAREWWWVDHAAASLSGLASADDVIVSVAYLANAESGGDVVICGDMCRHVVGITDVTSQPHAYARHFWVPPGSLIGAWVTQADVTPGPTVDCRWRITRLAI